MSLDDHDLRTCLDAIEQSLTHFREKPDESSAERRLYDDFLRLRESLVRARRDLRDPNVTQGPTPGADT